MLRVHLELVGGPGELLLSSHHLAVGTALVLGVAVVAVEGVAALPLGSDVRLQT